MYVFKYSVTKHEFVSLFFSLCRLFFACLEECYDYIRVYDGPSLPLTGRNTGEHEQTVQLQQH